MTLVGLHDRPASHPSGTIPTSVRDPQRERGKYLWPAKWLTHGHYWIQFLYGIIQESSPVYRFPGAISGRAAKCGHFSDHLWASAVSCNLCYRLPKPFSCSVLCTHHASDPSPCHPRPCPQGLAQGSAKSRPSESHWMRENCKTLGDYSRLQPCW